MGQPCSTPFGLVCLLTPASEPSDRLDRAVGQISDRFSAAVHRFARHPDVPRVDFRYRPAHRRCDAPAPGWVHRRAWRGVHRPGFRRRALAVPYREAAPRSGRSYQIVVHQGGRPLPVLLPGRLTSALPWATFCSSAAPFFARRRGVIAEEIWDHLKSRRAARLAVQGLVERRYVGAWPGGRVLRVTWWRHGDTL